MKRIFSLALVLIITAAAFTGCLSAKKETPYELYSRSAEKVLDADGIEVNCDITIGVFGVTMTMETVSKRNGDDIQARVSMMGETETVTYIDGMEYVDDDYGSYKYPSDGYDDDGISDGWLWKISEEAFEGKEFTENDDGTRSVSVDVDNSVFMEAFGGSELDDLFGDGDELAFENASLVLIFDDGGDLCSAILEGDMVISSEGISMTCSFVVDYEFINLGTAPTITLPSDPDSYELTDYGSGSLL